MGGARFGREPAFLGSGQASLGGPGRDTLAQDHGIGLLGDDEHERLVARRAPGLVDRERAGEADVLGDVARRKRHACPTVGRLDLERPSLVTRDDAPACTAADEVAVLHPRRHG